jgi:homoserine O-acetyltransferase/O-succinyltransferase
MNCRTLKRAVTSVTIALLSLAGSAICQEQQYANLGDLRLQSGAVIKNCRVGYRTHGKLNASRSNAVLWPTWFGGRSEDLTPMIGSGKLLDTDRFFVVAVDSLGNGVSTSPSNSTEQPGTKFPKYTIRDMVDSQYRMLTEKLGIQHLHAVMGQSLGGFEAFAWMVRYPDFMDVTIPVAGTPRAATSDILWASIEAESIRNDKDYNGGNYSHEPKMLAARYTHLSVMWTPNQVNTNIPPQDAAKFLAQGALFGGNLDANDWLAQLEAIITMNVYEGRSVEETAKLVKCKVLIITATQDHAVNYAESVRFADALGVQPLLLTDACGHMSVSCNAAKVTQVIQDFLK